MGVLNVEYSKRLKNSIIGAVITDIENGEMGLESFLTISTIKNKEYIISISNNNRFIITQIENVK